jgi:hypothetical protein
MMALSMFLSFLAERKVGRMLYNNLAMSAPRASKASDVLKRYKEAKARKEMEKSNSSGSLSSLVAAGMAKQSQPPAEQGANLIQIAGDSQPLLPNDPNTQRIQPSRPENEGVATTSRPTVQSGNTSQPVGSARNGLDSSQAELQSLKLRIKALNDELEETKRISDSDFRRVKDENALLKSRLETSTASVSIEPLLFAEAAKDKYFLEEKAKLMELFQQFFPQIAEVDASRFLQAYAVLTKNRREEESRGREKYKIDLDALWESKMATFEGEMKDRYERKSSELHEENKLWRTQQLELLQHEASRNAIQQMSSMSSLDAEAARSDTEFQLKKQYEDLMVSHREQLEMLSREREAKDLKRWEEAAKSMQALQENANRERIASEMQLQQKLEEAWDASRQNFMEQIAELREKLTSEKSSHLAAMQKVEQEAADKVYRLEQELQARYARMIEQQSSQVANSSTEELKKDLEALKEQTLLSSEKQMLQLRERAVEEQSAALKSLEASLYAKYEKKFKESEEEWMRECESREAAAENRLREHYEVLLKSKQDELDHAIQMNDNVDDSERERWLRSVEDLKQRQMAVMTSMEEKLRRKYESMMESYERTSAKRMEEYELTILKLNETHDAERSALHSKLRRYKVAANKWRYDIQSSLQQRYEAVANELEARYLKEAELRMKERAMRKEQERQDSMRAHELEMREKTRRADETRLAEETAATQEEANKKAVKLRLRMEQLRAVIYKLWDALEVDNGSIVQFYRGLSPHFGNAEALVEAFTAEVAKLKESVPLMQMVTRREFLKYRLELINRFASDPQRIFAADSNRLLYDDREREALFSELMKMTPDLLTQLKTFAAGHHSEFLYKSRPYLPVMEKDMDDITRASSEPILGKFIQLEKEQARPRARAKEREHRARATAQDVSTGSVKSNRSN